MAASEELLQAAWCQHGLCCGRLAQRYSSTSALVWALSSHLESCSLCSWYVLGKDSQKEIAIFCRVDGSASQCWRSAKRSVYSSRLHQLFWELTSKTGICIVSSSGRREAKRSSKAQEKRWLTLQFCKSPFRSHFPVKKSEC